MQTKIPLLIILSLLTTISEVNAASLESGLRSCGKIAGETERLNCYDGLLGTVVDNSADSEKASEKPATKKGFMQRITDAVGRERLDGKSEKEEEPVPESYAVTITNCKKMTSSKRVNFSLENGQVWRQKNARWLSLRNCGGDGVISEGYFGYKLEIKAMEETVGVVRIQ